MRKVTIQVPNPYNITQLLPRDIDYPPRPGRIMRDTIEIVERTTIQTVMKSLNYNHVHVAKALGITRTTLVRRLMKYDIPTINQNGTPRTANLMQEYLRTWKRFAFSIDIFRHNRTNLDNKDIFAYKVFRDGELLFGCNMCPVPLTISTDSNEFIAKIIKHALHHKWQAKEDINAIRIHGPILESFMLEYED